MPSAESDEFDNAAPNKEVGRGGPGQCVRHEQLSAGESACACAALGWRRCTRVCS